jgi:oxygen-independent coproporphyrinogen-3 oxidase
VAASLLKDNGYAGWVGKNTYSRTVGSSGCSDYLEKRVVRGIPYLGMGLGAQSFSQSTLAYNLGGVTKRLEQYVKSVELGRVPIQDLYWLSQSGAMGKFCSVSFYFGGISLSAFKANFGVSLYTAFPDKVSFVLDEGLMEYISDGDRLQLTSKGKSYYSGVLALFYAPHVQQQLLGMPGGEFGVMDALNGVTQTKRPYIGVPVSRYEYKPRKRDPRPELSADWANPTATTPNTMPNVGA